MLKLPTSESLGEVLSQLAAANGVHEEVLKATSQCRSKQQESSSEEPICFDYVSQVLGELTERNESALEDDYASLAFAFMI